MADTPLGKVFVHCLFKDCTFQDGMQSWDLPNEPAFYDCVFHQNRYVSGRLSDANKAIEKPHANQE